VAEGRSRPAWAEIDLDALRHNVDVLSKVAAPAALWAVVKADGYGHGATVCARAALGAGAAGLAVAMVDEGVELRDAGIQAPILLLSEPPPDAAPAVVAEGLTATVTTAAGADALARAAAAAGRRCLVHVKVDTGMHRVGASPAAAADLLGQLRSAPHLRPIGVWTHLAVADGGTEEDRAFTECQLDRFDEVRSSAAAAGATLVAHAANTAATVGLPRARYDLVRCGIGLYGVLPSQGVRERLAEVAPGTALHPVLSLKAQVSEVRRLPAGARPSYGRLRPLPVDSLVATVPLGYADGVPRRLFRAGYEVVIGGRRRPLAGMVTMDQIVVDCGPLGDVAVGDEVVLLGQQGNERVDVDEWARRLDTIGYEVLAGIGRRVPRRVTGASA